MEEEKVSTGESVSVDIREGLSDLSDVNISLYKCIKCNANVLFEHVKLTWYRSFECICTGCNKIIYVPCGICGTSAKFDTTNLKTNQNVVDILVFTCDKCEEV